MHRIVCHKVCAHECSENQRRKETLRASITCAQKAVSIQMTSGTRPEHLDVLCAGLPSLGHVPWQSLCTQFQTRPLRGKKKVNGPSCRCREYAPCWEHLYGCKTHSWWRANKEVELGRQSNLKTPSTCRVLGDGSI